MNQYMYMQGRPAIRKRRRLQPSSSSAASGSAGARPLELLRHDNLQGNANQQPPPPPLPTVQLAPALQPFPLAPLSTSLCLRSASATRRSLRELLESSSQSSFAPAFALPMQAPANGAVCMAAQIVAESAPPAAEEKEHEQQRMTSFCWDELDLDDDDDDDLDSDFGDDSHLGMSAPAFEQPAEFDIFSQA